MKAVDTNVLVRAIVADHEAQTALAEEVLQSDCFISHSVLLETVWVLESRYELGRAIIADVLMRILDSDTVHVASQAPTLWAVTSYAAGGDFADLVHLASAIDVDAFVTFDRQLSRRTDAPVSIELLR